MSLILEALRKSEAERRRGDAPDLRVELPPPALPKHRTSPTLWFAGAGLLALVAVVALWPRSDVPDGGSARDADPAAAHVATTAAPDAWPPAAPDDAMSARSGAATGSPSVQADAGFPRVERIQAPAAAPAPEPAPDLPLAPPPMAVRAAEEAAATETGVTAATADALRIAGLSSSQRERLPALKLSLHMWNDNPARRFAVIDGQRRIEGDRLGDATITAIDREGVLLDLDGQAVRVPLP